METIVEPDKELVELVERARGGDQSAFRDLYDMHAPAAYRVAAGVLGRGPEAEDAVQDAFVRVFDRLEQLREPGAFKAFLLRSVRNRAVDLVRRNRLIPMDPWDLPEDASPVAVAESPDVDDRLATEEAMDVARTALTALGERDATALTLAEASGLDGNDLAEALGVDNRQHAYVIVNRAKGRFRVAAGALLLVRHGRNCGDLKNLLADAGPFSPAVVRKVNAHVKDCDTCKHRRTLLLDSPEMAYALEGGPAPEAAVLEQMWAAIAAKVGGAGPVMWRRLLVIGGLIALILLAVVGAASLGGEGTPETSVPAGAVNAEVTTTSTSAPATTVAPESTVAPETAPPTTSGRSSVDTTAPAETPGGGSIDDDDDQARPGGPPRTTAPPRTTKPLTAPPTKPRTVPPTTR